MPLFWLSLAFLIGIILAAFTSLPAYGWVLIAVFPLLLIIPFIYKRWSRLTDHILNRINQLLKIPNLKFYPLMLTWLALGGLWYQIHQPSINPIHIAYYNDQSTVYIIHGVIVDPPDVRETYTNLRVRIEQLTIFGDTQSIPVRGNFLARVDQDTTVRYGDRIQLQGKLETPPEAEDFSYRDYLAHRGIYSIMVFPGVTFLEHGQGNPLSGALYALRDQAQEVVYQLFPDPEASLLSGILLGIQSGIPSAVQQAFRLTGTSHIIVISGFNISIIAAVFTTLFRRWLGRYRGALAAVAAIIIYTLLVGANAAVVRAAILGLFALVGQLIGRRQSGLNSLIFAGFLMALADPNVLWDVSFQLSFAATLGIMLYAEPLTNWFIKFTERLMPLTWAGRLAGPVSDYFLITLAAQLTTLPLMIYYFKRISLTSLIANPLILPAQPALMELGGLAVITGLLFRPLGQLFAWATWPLAAYTIRIVEWLATLPHGSLALGQVALPLILLFYLLLFLLTFFRARIILLVPHFKPAFPLSGMLLVTFLLWKAAFYAPDGKLHLTILDVGTGEAVLIQSPTGRYVLINGGPSTLQLSDALGRRLPPFQRALDWLVVAGIDNEDLSGLPANLERFHPANVLWAGNSYATSSSSRLWKELQSGSIPITRMQAGHSLDLGSGAILRVLSSSQRGAVMHLTWKNFRFLLPLGMDSNTQDALTSNSSLRNLSAVILAESGYAPLNPPELIAFMHPQLALLSVAAADRDGLPSPDTLDALEGYNLLRTDENGWIQITTDGSQMWVEVEKK